MVDRSSPLAIKWRLVRLDSGRGSPAPPLDGTEITAEFRDDGRLGGSAGCNRYMTSYEVRGASLSVNPQMASTQMWCEHPEGTMEQEAAFLGTWGRVASFVVREDELRLSDEKGRTVLVFIPEGTP